MKLTDAARAYGLIPPLPPSNERRRGFNLARESCPLTRQVVNMASDVHWLCNDLPALPELNDFFREVRYVGECPRAFTWPGTDYGLVDGVVVYDLQLVVTEVRREPLQRIAPYNMDERQLISRDADALVLRLMFDFPDYYESRNSQVVWYPGWLEQITDALYDNFDVA